MLTELTVNIQLTFQSAVYFHILIYNFLYCFSLLFILDSLFSRLSKSIHTEWNQLLIMMEVVCRDVEDASRGGRYRVTEPVRAFRGPM